MAKANHTSIDTMFSDVENPGLYFQMKKKELFSCTRQNLSTQIILIYFGIVNLIFLQYFVKNPLIQNKYVKAKFHFKLRHSMKIKIL